MISGGLVSSCPDIALGLIIESFSAISKDSPSAIWACRCQFYSSLSAVCLPCLGMLSFSILRRQYCFFSMTLEKEGIFRNQSHC